MKYLLDTNVCIIYLEGKNLSLKQRLEAIPVQETAISSIFKAELCFGAMKSADSECNFSLQQIFLAQFVLLPSDDLAATTCGAYDLQIAALAKLSEGIAQANNLTLVTHNTREFDRVEGLQVEDWEVEA